MKSKTLHRVLYCDFIFKGGVVFNLANDISQELLQRHSFMRGAEMLRVNNSNDGLFAKAAGALLSPPARAEDSFWL